MALGWLWWRAWALGTCLVAGDATQLCVAGVALGDIHLRSAWQARHLVTSTFVLRGRRGTYGTGLALVARLGALGCACSPVSPPNFAWQAWHLATSTLVSRGRRGTCRHRPSLRVAGKALGHIHLRFAWQAWHLWQWAGSGGALGRAGARLVAGDAAQLCVAGVALGDIHLRFAWHVALGDIDLRFEWHLVSSLTHPLSHTTLSHTIFHTPSFTHNFVTHHL